VDFYPDTQVFKPRIPETLVQKPQRETLFYGSQAVTVDVTM